MKTSSRFHRFVAFAFAALFAAASANAADTVLAHWPFTNGSLEDTSGNGHTIEVGEAVVTSDGYLSFPADAAEGTSWAQTTNAIAMDNSKTSSISLWVRKPDSSGSATLMEVSESPQNPSTKGAFLVNYVDGRVVLSFNTSRGGNVSTRKSPAGLFDDHEWHQIAATVSIGGNNSNPALYLYVDGKSYAEDATYSTSYGYEYIMGAKYYFARRKGVAGEGGSLSGDMDEIFVYANVIPAADVLLRYYRQLGVVYNGNGERYQHRLPDGWRVDAAGVISYRVRVISDRGVSHDSDVRVAGTNDFWFTENAINTLTAAAAAGGERIHWQGVPLTASFDAKGEAVSFVATEPVEIAINSFTPTHVWTGKASTDFAADGNWEDASGAVTSAPNGPAAHVYIPETPANQPTATVPISVGDLRVGSLTNGATMATFTAQMTATNVIGGSCWVFRNGTLTHKGQSASARLRMKVGGDMTVCFGGKVDADKKGETVSPTAKTGGSYGGGGSNRNGNGCIGSILEPTSSGGTGHTANADGYPGGVIYLDVAGVLHLDGTISANAPGYGSAGSVFVKTAKLEGAGTISARNSGGGYPGGGGRIAVYERIAADWSAFGKERFLANGSKANTSYHSGAGSIYLETAADDGHGELIFDNAGSPYLDYSSITTSVGGHDHLYGHVTVKGGAAVQLRAGVTLRTIRGVSTAGGTLISTDTTSGVEIVPEKGETATVEGTLTVGKFLCSAPGSTLEFVPGSVVAGLDNATVELHGTTEEPLVMRSATAGGAYYLDIGEAPKMSVDHVTVSDCAARGTAIADVGGTGIGENPGWTFPPDVIPGQTNVWTGESDGQWANSMNWQLERTPNDTDHVVIPGGLQNYPTLIDPFVANSLSISNGATVTLSAGADFTVTNALYAAGRIVAAGKNEELHFAGEGEQSVNFCGGAFAWIVIEKTGGGIDFSDGFEATSLVCRATSPVSLTFKPGRTVRIVDNLLLDGLVIGGETDEHLLTLASAVSGSTWNLAVNGAHAIRGVSVSDCDASSGRLLKAGVLSTGASGRNENWDFSSTAAAEWIGGNGNGWEIAENWHPTGVPGSETHVRVAAAGASVLVAAGTAAVPAYALTIGGGTDAVTFTARAPFSLGDSLAVLSGGTAAFNTFDAHANVIERDLLVAEGGTLTHEQGEDTNKLDVRLRGRVIVEYGAGVDATGKGYLKKNGPGSGNMYGASHGGTGGGSTVDSYCYGSFFCPTNCGTSVGGAPSAGGSIRIFATGEFAIFGSIFANGTEGSGGSVWLQAARIFGKGSVCANGGAGSGTGSGGGRVALYQTVARDFSCLDGLTVTANGSAYGIRIGGGGTIYRQHAGQVDRGGEIIKSYGDATPLPLIGSRNVDGASAFRQASLVLQAAGLRLTSDLKMKDLDIQTESGTIDLQGHVLKLTSGVHKNGVGWARSYDQCVIENGGKIIWPQGFAVIVR